MKEMWKWIPNYEGLYQASNHGRIKRVRSEKKDARNRTRIKNEVILKPYLNNTDRELVRLSKNGKTKTFLVYRLVAITFIPNPLNKKTINHINGNHKDNKIENLEWCSFSDNMKHSWDNGLR